MMSDLGSLVTFAGNTISQERALRQQVGLQHDAQQWNETMWERTNQYNSPQAQMQRFKSAGLNPNLIYGAASGASGASAPSMSSSAAPSPAQMPPIELAQLALLRAQKDNIEADTSDKIASAAEKGASANLLTTQEMVSRAELDIHQRLSESQIKLNDEQSNQLRAIISQIAASTEKIKVDTAIASLQLEWDRKSFDARVNLVKAQARQSNSSANLSEAQARQIATLLTQELSNLQAEFANIQAQTNLTDQQRSNLAQQKLIDAADNFYLKLATEYHKKGSPLAVGAEMVHMFTHLFKFGKSF